MLKEMELTEILSLVSRNLDLRVMPERCPKDTLDMPNIWDMPEKCLRYFLDMFYLYPIYGWDKAEKCLIDPLDKCEKCLKEAFDMPEPKWLLGEQLYFNFLWHILK